MTDLTGRRALITGAGSGIGEAIARAFASAGAEVTVADRDEDAVHRLSRDIDGKPWVVDLSDTAALVHLKLDTDILVNNAGVQHVTRIEDFDPVHFSFMVRLMLEAPFLLIRAVLPGMYQRGFGRIINISSVHGFRASAYKAAYVAAKHGLEGISRVAALEGGPRGVTSNCIDPGYLRTDLVERQLAGRTKIHSVHTGEVLPLGTHTGSPVKELIEPGDVASLALWLASDAARLATGSSYDLMKGDWRAA